MKMLILATGSNTAQRARGFTLIEVLVVLTIMALLMALMVPAISRGFGQSLHEVARDMQIGLRKARATAASQQRSASFVVNLQEGTYQKGSAMLDLPEGFELQAQVATAEIRGNKAGIRFYPDGSSSGGRIGIREGDALIWLEVDWLTGRILLQDE